jgi:alpha-L-fucosidase
MNLKLKSTILAVLLIISSLGLFAQSHKVDDPKMDWWKEAKFGMFIHWGLYSIPAGTWGDQKMKRVIGSEWILNVLKIPIADYTKLAPQFNPTNFNADNFVLLAKEAGMKYMVFTAKHCEGFAMFQTAADPFNIMDASPYKKDIVKALAESCKKYDMPFGVYYAQALDWYHAGGGSYDKKWDKAQEGRFSDYIEKVSLPQVKELVTNYQPRIIWFDTPAEMTPELAKRFTDFLVQHPDIIVNDRLGGNVEGDLTTPEQYIPATGIPGKNWESCMTMNGTWGYNVDDHDWKSTETLVRNLIDIASKGGNYLLNVGPDATGLIPQPSVERLKEVGKWMKVNGEAIYGTQANPFSETMWGRVTQKQNGKNTKLFLHIFDWPTDGKIALYGLQNKVKKAYALANPAKNINTVQNTTQLTVSVNGLSKSKFSTVVVLEIVGETRVVNKPEIKSDASIFIDKARFVITSPTPNSVLRYTIDNTEPTALSAIATGEICVEQTDFVVKARIFVNNKAVSAVAERRFVKSSPMPALNTGKKGFSYKYYEGVWNNLPDFSKLIPIKTGTVDRINLEIRQRDHNYGLLFDGWINVPETNVYTFYLASDDGSRLIIDSQTVIDYDGVHGAEEKSVELPLAAGWHKISLQYFQQEIGQGLKLEWQPQGKPRSEIDKTLLLH